jgi:hypothetical protein
MPFAKRDSVRDKVWFTATAEQLQHSIFALQCHCTIAIILKLADRRDMQEEIIPRGPGLLNVSSGVGSVEPTTVRRLPTITPRGSGSNGNAIHATRCGGAAESLRAVQWRRWETYHINNKKTKNRLEGLFDRPRVELVAAKRPRCGAQCREQAADAGESD